MNCVSYDFDQNSSDEQTDNVIKTDDTHNESTKISTRGHNLVKNVAMKGLI